MSTIPEILSQNSAFRLDDPIPDEATLRDCEKSLGWSLPRSYREFVGMGGLNDLGFANTILGPSEISQNRGFLPAGYVPFASNGCGDLYCWETQSAEPPVQFWDHETGKFETVSPSFIDWLRENRR